MNIFLFFIQNYRRFLCSIYKKHGCHTNIRAEINTNPYRRGGVALRANLNIIRAVTVVVESFSRKAKIKRAVQWARAKALVFVEVVDACP